MKVAIAILVALVGSVICLGAHADTSAVNSKKVSIYYDSSSGQFSVTKGVLDTKNAVAYGRFYDEITKTGWGRLYVHVNPAIGNANAQSYAAGLVEGVLTAYRIAQHWQNFYSFSFENKTQLYNAATAFFEQQNTWMLQQIKQNTQDPYWRQVGYLSNQMAGMYQGYQMEQSQEMLPDMSFTQMYMLGSWGDLLDLPNALIPNHAPRFSDMTPSELAEYFSENGHCSALIVLTGDLSEMFSGHTSWFKYSFMLRIMKWYDLPYADSSTSASIISFSSYPGSLMSGDDFYLTNAGLNVIETSIGVVNKTLWQTEISPESIFCWQRTMLANRMSTNGRDWTNTFSKYNSGTYNNQWMVVDYKLFTPGSALPDNLLWIAEQVPGYVESADVTHVLRFGYWPSYNIAYFKTIRDVSGWTQLAANNPQLNYETAPRANIFRRNHTDVVDLSSMQRMLRYNNWEQDPYSLGSAGNQISSRFDLNVKNPACSGGYDSKVTTWQAWKTMTMWAQSGPTHDQQPVFEWASAPCPTASHVGQPPVFGFDWITFASDQ